MHNLKFSHFILFSLFAVFVLDGCSQKRAPEKEQVQIPVKTMIVHARQVVFPIQCSGILSKKSEMKLSFKTGGVILKIPVDEGDLVQEHELLASLNLSEINAHASQVAQALKKATRDYSRVQNLYHDSVATLENLQNSSTALQVARSRNHIAQFNLKYSVIRAPANGRILKRLAEPNEIIAPGHPVFFFSSTANDWVVRCNLPDLDRVLVHFLDSAKVFFDAYPNIPFRATVTELGDWADPYTGTYEIELKVASDTLELVSGFIGKVSVYPTQTRKSVMIPAGSLVLGKGEKGFVYKVLDGKPVMQAVTFSKISGDSLAVSKGLQTGDEVITEGSYYVDNSSSILILSTANK